VVLRIGQKVPGFTLFDSEGKERKLSELIKSGSLVIAFFPFAFSGVCDREMCVFRDGLSPTSVGDNFVGISVDSVFTLKIFGETYGLGFPLLSDFNKKVTKAFNVLQETWAGFGYKGVAKRAVFVVDKRSVLRYRWIGESPEQEPPYEEVASALGKLN
jgi:peroxiredoxin